MLTPVSGTAQSAGNLLSLPGGATNTAPIGRLSVGDGRTVAPRGALQVGSGSGTLVAVASILSPGNHDGSAATVSAANSNRLAGVVAGPNDTGKPDVSILNPTRRPVLSGATPR